MNNQVFCDAIVWLVREAYKVLRAGSVQLSIDDGRVSGQFIAKNGITIKF